MSFCTFSTCRGDTALLTSFNLSLETNLNHWGPDLVFLVVEGPLHGALYVEDATADRFSALGKFRAR